MNILYDFWLSDEAEKKQFPFLNVAHVTKLFKGQPYTEMIEHGRQPVGQWPDLRFIGSGYKGECEYKLSLSNGWEHRVPAYPSPASRHWRRTS